MTNFSAACILLTLLFTVNGLRGAGSSKIPTGCGSPRLDQSSSIITDQVSFHHTPKKEGRSTVRAETVFILKVRVKDGMSHTPLSQACVDVITNYTLISSSMTDRDGVTLLRIPYTQANALSLVINKDGYIQTTLPWTTSKMPTFSSMTISLYSQNQGNIWVYEDSVYITGQISDVTLQPTVQFPRSRLLLSDSNISSLTAYLTGPKFPAEKHHFPYTVGIIMSKSGIRSIELRPVAAVSVQLLYNGKDVQVNGPIRITLPVSESSRSLVSDTIPAWFYNRKTGAWVNHGLGTVRFEDGSAVWVYIAPHLGYWIAAPFPSFPGYLSHESTLNFISHHLYLLTATLSGIFVIAVGLCGVMSCYCRGSSCRPEEQRSCTTKAAIQKKDQTTCTNSDEHLEICFRDTAQQERSHTDASQTTYHGDGSINSEIKGLSSLGKTEVPTLQIYENIAGMAPEPQSSHPSLYVNSSEIRLQGSLNENVFLPEQLVLYPQSFRLPEIQDSFVLTEQQCSRSNKLPRKSVLKDTFPQTLPKTLLLYGHQQVQEGVLIKDNPYEDPGLSRNPGSWNCFNSLVESVSVPEVLNEAAGMDNLCRSHQGNSEQTLLELTKSKPFPQPRSWFVSLEGKPAAQIHHSVIELRKIPPLSDSKDTSLDSGVDLQQGCMSHLAHRAVCSEDVELSRRNTFTTRNSSTSLQERREVCKSKAHKRSDRTHGPLV